MSTPQIEAVLKPSACYNPESIPFLENYVKQQVEQQSYNLEANLALLRLYRFHPERENAEIVSVILALALTQYPGKDFLLCTYLLSDKSVGPLTLSACYACTCGWSNRAGR
jgi:translation initiation factor 3 subunit K